MLKTDQCHSLGVTSFLRMQISREFVEKLQNQLTVTSRNSDTILCIFSLDLCLPLYSVINISMIYDYLYIRLLMFTPLPIYLLQTLSFTAFQVIGNQLPPTLEDNFSNRTYILH